MKDDLMDSFGDLPVNRSEPLFKDMRELYFKREGNYEGRLRAEIMRLNAENANLERLLDQRNQDVKTLMDELNKK